MAVLLASFTLTVATAAADTLVTPACGGATRQAGIFFDASAANAVNVTALGAHLESGGAFRIYGKPGSHVGFEANAGAWTLLGSGTAPAGYNAALPAALNVNIPAGQTYAFHIATDDFVYVGYNVGTSVGSPLVSDANLMLKQGNAANPPDFSGVAYSPRTYVGQVQYTTAAAVPTLSEWAMIGLGALLLAAGVVAINRRRFAI